MAGRNMAKIIKLIWRLDYKVSYAYIDARGTALRAISESVDRFWEVVGDGVLQMSFAARHADEETLRTLSLETTSMNGSLEWRCGIDLARALSSEQFRGIDRITKEMLKVCQIRSVVRAGVRIFALERYADGRKDALKRTLALIDNGLRTKIGSSLGPISDVGVVLEGTTPDKVNYRVVHGPYDKKNVEQTLEKKPTEDQYRQLADFDLFFDIDLFESNFSFEEHTLFRWTETKIAKATDLIEVCSGTPKQK